MGLNPNLAVCLRRVCEPVWASVWGSGHPELQQLLLVLPLLLRVGSDPVASDSLQNLVHVQEHRFPTESGFPGGTTKETTKGHQRRNENPQPIQNCQKRSNDTSEYHCQELPMGTSKPQLAERWVWQKAKTKSLGFTSGRGTNVAQDIPLGIQSNAPACCSSKTSGQKCCLLDPYFLSKALEIDVGLRALVTTNCTSASSMPREAGTTYVVHIPNCAEPEEVSWKKHCPGTAHRGIMKEEGGTQGCLTESSLQAMSQGDSECRAFRALSSFSGQKDQTPSRKSWGNLT